MRNPLTLLLYVFALFVLAGCGLVMLSGCGLLESSEIPHVELNAARSTFAPGDEVKLMVVNFSERTFIVHPDLCGAWLQQQHPSSSWRDVEGDEPRVCTDVGRYLEPNRQVSARQRLSETLPSGQYRYAYEIHSNEEEKRAWLVERITLFTKGFEVRP